MVHPTNEERLVQNFLSFLPIVFNEIPQSNSVNDLRPKSIQLDMLCCFIEKNLAVAELNPTMAAEHLEIGGMLLDFKALCTFHPLFGSSLPKYSIEK